MDRAAEINSQQYWDERFRSDWEARGGRFQTFFFGQIALEAFPSWLVAEIEREHLSICDWGCALGEAGNLLAARFSGSRVTGVDISSAAVEKARATYRNVEFLAMDLKDSSDQYDVVFSSNTLEHFEDPISMMAVLAAHCRRYLVLLVPFQEYTLMPEHRYTFDYGNVPTSVGGRFILAHGQVLDLSAVPCTYYAGYQALLVYADKESLSADHARAIGQAVVDSPTFIAPGLEVACERIAGLALKAGDAASCIRKLQHEMGQAQAAWQQNEQALWAKLGDRDRLLEAERQKQQQLQAELAQRDAVLQAREQQLQAERAERDAQLQAERAQREAVQADLAQCDQRLRSQAANMQQLRTDLGQRNALLAAKEQQLQAELTHREQLRLAHERREQELRTLLAHQEQAAASQLAEQQQALASLTDVLEETRANLGASRSTIDTASSLAGAVADIRVSRRYKIGNILSAFKRRPLGSLGTLAWWVIGGYRKRGIGLAGALHAPDPLQPIHQTLAHLRTEGPTQAAVVQTGPASPIPAPASSLEEMWKFVRAHTRQAAGRPFVLIVSGTVFTESEGQRPTRLARELAHRGASVLFAYWRWDQTVRPQSPEFPLVHQVPLDVLLDAHADVLGWSGLQSREKWLLLEFPDPRLVEVIGVAVAAGWRSVYDVIDDWEEFHKVGEATWYDRDAETYLACNVDVLCATTPVLADKMRAWGSRRVVLLPNALEPDSFGTRPPHHSAPAQGMAIGYFGHLTGKWFDWDLVTRTAAQHPEWVFELIGYGQPEGQALPPNVHLLGKVAHHRLAEHAARWDVAIIPFRTCALSRAVDPIKIYEYIALGLPTVVTGMAHLSSYPGVRVAEADAKSFATSIEEAAAARPSDSQIVSFVNGNSWSARLDTLQKALRDERLRSVASDMLEAVEDDRRSEERP